MKIFNKIASALMVLPVVAALTACSDDDGKYTPAEKLTTAQVYFSNLLPTKVELVTEGEGVVNVTLNRVKTDEAMTVNLVATQPEEQAMQFVVPENVTFAEGESSTTIEVTYDPTQVEYDKDYVCQLSIADEEYTTPYGGSTYDFTASISSPMTDWVTNASAFAAAGGIGEWPFGSAPTATYTYYAYAEAEQEGVKVAVRQNTKNPGVFQILLQNWGAGVYTENGVQALLNAVWDEEEQVYRIAWDPMLIGYTHSSYGPMACATVPEYATSQTWENWPSSYDPATGKFTLYMVYFVSAGNFTPDVEYMQMDGFYVPDLSASVSYAGILTSPDEAHQAVVDFTIGPDAAGAKFALTDASQKADEVAEAIANGTIEADDAVNGRNYITLGEDGKYRVTLVTFDEEGKIADVSSVVIEFAAGGSVWESLGMGLYTDDFMTYGYYDEENDYAWVSFYEDLEPQTYEVEVFANTQTEGLYRLKNAYGAAYPFNEEGDWDASMDYYLVIDAQKPEYVMIDNQELGLNWYDLGMVSVESDGSYYVNKYGMEPADIVAALASQGGDDPFGKFADGVITFPADAFGVYVGEDSFYGNHNGAFKLVLPEAASESDIKAAKFAQRMRHYKRLNAKAKSLKTTGKVHFRLNARINKGGLK